MIAKRNYRVIPILVIILLFTFQSCNFDQVESEFSDFKTADKDGLFDKGWIPSDLVFNSMTNIYQRTNPDLNSCIFNYNLTKTDLEKLKLKVQPSSVRFKKLHRVRTSSDWIKSANQFNHYYYVRSSQTDTVYIAIDEKNSKIYGWRK